MIIYLISLFIHLFFSFIKFEFFLSFLVIFLKVIKLFLIINLYELFYFTSFLSIIDISLFIFHVRLTWKVIFILNFILEYLNVYYYLYCHYNYIHVLNCFITFY
jgi:hypothetical protein